MATRVETLRLLSGWWDWESQSASRNGWLALQALLLADFGRAVEGSGQAPRHVDSLDRSSRDLLNLTQTFMRKSQHTVMINFKTKLRRC